MSVRSTAAAALVLVAPLAACTGGGGSHADGSATGSPAAAAAAPARWWTSGADYCGVLRQTVRAGRSILPDVSAKDPVRLASARAFVAEVQRTAPDAVAGAWRVVGPAVLAIVGSGGDLTSVHAADRAALGHATSTIATHARHTCHLDLRRS